MAGPNATNYFRKYVFDALKKVSTSGDIDGGALKFAFYLGSSMAGTFNFDTDQGYSSSTAPWNTTGEVTSTGTGSWGAGGLLLSGFTTPPTVAFTTDTATHSIALTLSPFTLGPGITCASGWDHMLLYDTTSGSSNAAIACYYLGSPTPQVMTSGTVLTFDFADTPQVNNAFYGS